MTEVVKWYFALDGEVYGPVDTAEILRLTQSGQLSSSSMVLKEGESQWAPLERVADLAQDKSLGNEGTYIGEKSEVLKSSPQEVSEDPGVFDLSKELPTIGQEETAVETEGPFHWVVLKQVEENGKPKFIQDGPFTTDEILAKIQTGEIKYSDHCWREGFSDWRLVREEGAFASPPTGTTPDLVQDFTAPASEAPFQMPEAVELEDIGESVQFSSTEAFHVELQELAPEGVEGVNLAPGVDEDLSFVFTQEETGVTPAAGVGEKLPEKNQGEQPTPEKEIKRSLGVDKSVVMELDQVDKSVVREPIMSENPMSPKSSEALPENPLAEPAKPKIYTSSHRAVDQPHIRQKLLEAEMQASSPSALPPGAVKYLVLLIAALVLLIFGLRLVKDLGG